VCGGSHGDCGVVVRDVGEVGVVNCTACEGETQTNNQNNILSCVVANLSTHTQNVGAS
jgi:hypothetical protein